jgi:hypothetical protein
MVGGNEMDVGRFIDIGFIGNILDRSKVKKTKKEEVEA